MRKIMERAEVYVIFVLGVIEQRIEWMVSEEVHWLPEGLECNSIRRFRIHDWNGYVAMGIDESNDMPA